MERQRQMQRYRDDCYEDDRYISTPNALKDILGWIAFFGIAALVIMVAVFILNNISLVLTIGKVLFIILCVVAGLLIVCLVTVAIVWCVRFVTKVQTIEPGDKGVWVRNAFGKMKILHPVRDVTVKQATDNANGVDTRTVPKFADLLGDFIVPGMIEILLGITTTTYDKLVGTWDDLKTFAVYGFGRVGKTNTLIFYIIQAIFTGCTVWVCDFHVAKGTGLSNMLQPLRQWIRFFVTPDDLVEAMQEYNDELNRRQLPESKGQIFPTWFIAIDEWNGYLDQLSKNDRKRVVGIAERLSREAAGFNMFGMFAIHELSDKQIGSATLRQSFLGVVCHALDVGYSKWVFTNSKHQKQTSGLAKGEVLLRNAETREVTQLRIPRILPKDIVVAAQKMYDYDQDTIQEHDGLPSPEDMDRMYHLADRDTISVQTGKIVPATYPVYPNASNSKTLPDVIYIGNHQESRQEANGTVPNHQIGANSYGAYQGIQTPVTPSTGSNQPEKQEDDLAVLRRIGKRIKEGEDKTKIRRELMGTKSGRALQEVNEAMILAEQLVEDEE